VEADMSFALLLAVATLSAEPKAALILDKVRSVDDPRLYDLRDQLNGDRGVPRSCSVSDNAVVTLALGRNATLEVDRKGVKKTIVVENTMGLGRSTLACGTTDDFYYANPRLGRLYAYSVARLFGGDDPVVWSRQIEPFRSLDDVKDVMTDASIATAVQLRQRLVLIEWFYRENGTTGFWHAVFDAASGTQLDKIGPSDVLLKLNERDPWWVAFQGGGNETANYVPQNLFRLRYGVPDKGVDPAAVTIEGFRDASPSPRLKAITKVSTNPVINHMIALLSPTRTSTSTTIEFCPTVPGQRARYWLGGDYDAILADVARNVLLAVWAERQTEGMVGSPIDAWFSAEIAPREPMKTVLTRFNPQDDAWIVAYQRALFTLGGESLQLWLDKYGAAAGVVRTPSEPRGQ
jgi:hypothetical protein